MQYISSLQYPSVLCDPTVPELGADWVGAPLGHAAHPHQRLPGEEDLLNLEHRLVLQVGMGRGRWRGRGRGCMRMSERVGWSVWLCKQGSTCVCMCVCVCACMHACIHACGWRVLFL